MFNFKTSKIGRFINQNMLVVGITILAIAFVILVVQILNQGAKEDKRIAETNNSVEDPTSETIISGSNVPEEKNDENKNIIYSFIEYCNDQKIEEAYSLISTECKDELYPTVEDFQKLYSAKVFPVRRSYNIQSWISNYDKYTYKVNLLNDILAAGQYDKSEIIDDYYTIISEKGTNKLNINSYIGKKDINISKQENDVNIEVVKKQTYMDYEQYTIKVENKSNYDIMLDSKESMNKVYLLDENNVEYSAYMDEKLEEELFVPKNESKTIDVKFSKIYNPDLKIEYIVFSDIIQDYEIYTILKDKTKYGGRLKVQIDI